jgi:hypothetical protein
LPGNKGEGMMSEETEKMAKKTTNTTRPRTCYPPLTSSFFPVTLSTQ